MFKAKHFSGQVLGLSALVLAIGAFTLVNQSHAEKPMKVRWLIAHQPATAFRRAAKTFNEELKKETNGQMEIVVLEPKDVGSKTDNVEPRKIFQLLANGDVELSQTVTTGIGELEPNFYVLDLPFLFQSHEHATRVLEGKVGHELLASLEKDKVHGLAFTYSGGFRVIPSTDRAIHSVKDFRGLRVRTTNSPVAQATLRQLGAIPVPLSLEQGQSALNYGDVDAAETTYIRVTSVIGDHSKYLNETQHSLFLTSILASSRFYKSLTPAQQGALERAAVAAARIERQDSVADGVLVKKEFMKQGVKVVKMSKADEKAFHAKMKPVYEKFEPMFGKTLIEEIKAEAKPGKSQAL
jgi:tripartite ATP-independent transporter DctP family solute receptor